MTTRTRREAFNSLATVVAVAIGAGCFPPREPVHAVLQIPTLRVHGDVEQVHDGFTVSATPITLDNQRRFPEIFKTIRWTEMVTSGTQSTAVERTADGVLVPLPSFRVQLTNHTGHVVRLTEAIFRLTDNLGRTYPLFSGTSELLAWNEGAIAMAAPQTAGNPAFMAQVRAGVGNIPLIGRAMELLDRDDSHGYLVFNLGVNTQAEQLAFLTGVERLTLRIAEVPVETDQAGAVTRTAEFEFVYDKTTVGQPVTCPPGTSTPSADVCTPD